MRLLPTFAVAVLATASAFAVPEPPVPAVGTSSLTTGGDRIRQFAFDGKPDTAFASDKPATKDDHFTLTFEKPVTVKSVTVTTGRPKGEDALTAGIVELSTDGKTFAKVGTFADGKATAKGSWKAVTALRIRPTDDLKCPLVIREIAVDSDPKVATFRHPIEFTLDVSDAPEMRPWGENVVRVCEKEYPAICDYLASDGFRPLTQIRLTLKSDYKGVAYASGNRIVGSVKFFTDHPTDIGAMVHETVHCVQQYRARNNPGWLVEGVADYYRFWKYEPGKAGRVNPARAKYDDSYRTTAAFLAYVTDKHDPKLVPQLNALMRAGKYDEGIWKKLTGKTADELNRDWKKSLAK